MSISPKVSQTIQFLNSLDPTKESVTWKENKLAKVEKRSALHNFFSWFIYLITFTLVPRNRELDQITQEILKDLADDIGNATVQEKDVAEKAVRILNEVSAHNGGSRGNELDQLLATMEKIQGLPDVQRLVESPKKGKKESPEPEVKQVPKKPIQQDLKNDEPKEAPETKETQEAAKPKQSDGTAKVQKLDSDNRALQRMLQDIFLVVEAKEKKGEEVNPEEELREFWQQLPSLDDTVSLSKDELNLLKDIFLTNPDFVSEHLSPKLLTCLVRNCHEISDFEDLARCVSALTLDKKLVLALIKGFEKDQKPAKEDVDSEEKEIAGLRHLYRSLVATIPAFKDDLTADELRGFILCLIEYIGKSHPIEATSAFYCILDIIDAMPNLKKDRMILKALCQVKEKDCLKQIYALIDAADIGFVIEEILKTLSLQQNDPDEVNFAEFISKVMESVADSGKEDICRNFLEHVFKNLSTKRQAIVFSKLTAYWIAHCLEVIPATVFSTLDSSIVRDVAGEVWQQHIDAPNDKRLPAFAKAITVDHLIELANSGSLNDVCVALLPLTDSQTQIQFVNKVLDAASSALHECLEKTQLVPDVYAQASKLNAKREFRMVRGDYSPEIWAAIVNGQIGNDEFLREFFDYVIPMYDERDQSRAACFAYLKPEVFVFAEPQNITRSQWCEFFKALREMKDQQQAKTLLISAVLNLFNKLEFPIYSCPELYTMTREQMLLLPIDQFHAPEIRLLIAILTDRLDDGLIATANSLYDSQKGAIFFDLFKEAYAVEPDLTPTDLEERKLAFKQNTQCLKNFLMWVVNRPALLPTWNWINEYLDYTKVLLEDADLQILIQQAGLKVNDSAKSSPWEFV